MSSPSPARPALRRARHTCLLSSFSSTFFLLILPSTLAAQSNTIPLATAPVQLGNPHKLRRSLVPLPDPGSDDLPLDVDPVPSGLNAPNPDTPVPLNSLSARPTSVPGSTFAILSSSSATFPTSFHSQHEYTTKSLTSTDPLQTPTPVPLPGMPGVPASKTLSNVGDQGGSTWKVVGIAVIAVLLVCIFISVSLFSSRLGRFAKDVLCGCGRKRSNDAEEALVPDWDRWSWDVKFPDDTFDQHHAILHPKDALGIDTVPNIQRSHTVTSAKSACSVKTRELPWDAENLQDCNIHRQLSQGKQMAPL